MKMPPAKKRAGPMRALSRRSRRFAEDAQGASLVEFAFMFPILVLVLFMTITLSHMMMIDRKVTLTAQSVADFVSQWQEVTPAVMDQTKTAAELMMQPFATDFDISIVHVPFDDVSGAPDMGNIAAWRALIKTGAVAISDADAEAAANGATVSAPPSAVVGPLGTPGDALIMLRMNYRYQSLWRSDFSLFGINFPGVMTFSKETYARPRLIRQIASNPVNTTFIVP